MEKIKQIEKAVKSGKATPEQIKTLLSYRAIRGDNGARFTLFSKFINK
jgi:hypothetical protein